MAIDRSKFFLGPMNVSFNGIDLGATKGGSSVKLAEKHAELLADQTGSIPQDYVVSGQEASVKMSLAEIKNLDNWKVAFPRATITGAGPRKVEFKTSVGSFLSDSAGVLILHPTRLDSSDKSLDFTCPVAIAKSSAELKYHADNQVTLDVEFVCLPNVDGVFMVHGDPAVGLTAASLVQASYAGTGNGVLSLVAAGASAVNETITATCVTAAVDGGVFYVTGSVSGPLGLTTVGTTFTHAKAVFKINDGSTDFIVGDAFTLTSVGLH